MVYLSGQIVAAGAAVLMFASTCDAQWTRSTRSTTTKAKTTSTRSTKTTSTRTTQTTKAAVTSNNSTSYAAPAPTATGDWYKPALGSSLLWSLESVIPVNPVSDTGIELNMDAYDVDLFDTSAAQIKTYKSRGKKVICYFSGGSYEPWRTGDKTKLKPECYCNKQNSCKMDGWDEWWLDLHTPACVSNIQQVMSERIALAKEKGCDAVEVDNEDAYTNKVKAFKINIDDTYNYLKFLSDAAHNKGLGIGLKNSPGMIRDRPEVVKFNDFLIIEECAKYNECAAYQPFVDAKKATWQVEYETKTPCTMPGFTVLSYSSYAVDYKNIYGFCQK